MDNKRILSDEKSVKAATQYYESEFPANREDEAQVTRREFCNFLGLTSAALFIGTGAFAGKAAIDASVKESFISLRIEGAELLLPDSSLNFRYPTEKDSAILVRSTDGSFHAYGQKCTHLSCPVYYEAKKNRLECPCHEGSFEVATGNVIAGPPPRSLDVIELDVKPNGEVWAIGRSAGGQERNV